MILLDAGHGFDTPGKRTPMLAEGYYINEWQINICFAMAAYRRLVEMGLDVLFTNIGINDLGIIPRADYINSCGRSRRVDVCIRFHANSAAEAGFSSASGLEVLHFPSAKSEAAAQELLKRIAPRLLAFGVKNRGIKPRRDLGILNRTIPRTLLIETGFMSNLQELKTLASPAYQDAIGQAVAEFCLGLI